MFPAAVRSGPGVTMSIEVVEHQGVRYAEVIRASVRVEKTTFFSPAESSFQFGLLAHEAGYLEEPHYHREFSREVSDLQQMFVVQRGVVGVLLYADDGALITEIILKVTNPNDLKAVSASTSPFSNSGTSIRLTAPR